MNCAKKLQKWVMVGVMCMSNHLVCADQQHAAETYKLAAEQMATVKNMLISSNASNTQSMSGMIRGRVLLWLRDVCNLSTRELIRLKMSIQGPALRLLLASVDAGQRLIKDVANADIAPEARPLLHEVAGTVAMVRPLLASEAGSYGGNGAIYDQKAVNRLCTVVTKDCAILKPYLATTIMQHLSPSDVSTLAEFVQSESCKKLVAGAPALILSLSSITNESNAKPLATTADVSFWQRLLAKFVDMATAALQARGSAK